LQQLLALCKDARRTSLPAQLPLYTKKTTNHKDNRSDPTGVVEKPPTLPGDSRKKQGGSAGLEPGGIPPLKPPYKKQNICYKK